jgi:peptidoglycan hydrolase-like protein with peptidoglycan-binding domain
MRHACTVLLAVLMATAVFADELTRSIQERLKDQGFYYGTVNGQPGAETSAAIRRYQIRHGLRVTGELNEETRRSLGVGTSAVPSEPGARTTPPPYVPRGSNAPQSREYYPNPNPDYYGPDQRRGSPDYADPRDLEPPPQYDQPRADIWRSQSYRGDIFAGTPYERAPIEIRQNVLFAVQGELAHRGLYRSAPDGEVGPETVQAIARFQQGEGLAVTGRLDTDTLADLRVLPGQEKGPPGSGAWRGSGREQVYRGIWLR